MIQFINGLRAALLSGLGFGKFTRGKYRDAIKYLEKAFELSPDEERIEVHCSILGQSYLAVGEKEKALEHLSLGYKHYKNPKCLPKANESDYFRTMYGLLTAYYEVLVLVEHHDMAEEIKIEIDNLNKKKGP